MRHIIALRIINAFFALLAFGVGGASFGYLTYPVMGAGVEGESFMAAIGGLIALVMAGLGLAHLVLAATLGPKRRRPLQSMLALGLIMTFPLGTFYALYALWVCWANPETRNYLAGEELELPFPAARMAHA